MYEKIPTANLSREEWLALRRTGIGGSDAGAICGLDPYSSPMKVYQDKTGDGTGGGDNEALRQGRDLEEYVAQRFMEATGLKVRRSNYMYRSKGHPFMIADVDRLVVGEDAGLECKTASAYSADKWEGGRIPLHYVLQCCHYMAVTGRRSWYIAVVILGREFKYYRLDWDDALIGKMVEAEEKFWEGNVRKGVMPGPDGSKACDEVLAQCFGSARKGSSVDLVGFDGKLARREEILAQIGELEKEQKRIEQEVKLFMKDSERAASAKYSVIWGNVETDRLDAGRMKEERPEVYREYVKASISRRFQVRAA